MSTRPRVVGMRHAAASESARRLSVPVKPNVRVEAMRASVGWARAVSAAAVQRAASAASRLRRYCADGDAPSPPRRAAQPSRRAHPASTSAARASGHRGRGRRRRRGIRRRFGRVEAGSSRDASAMRLYAPDGPMGEPIPHRVCNTAGALETRGGEVAPNAPELRSAGSGEVLFRIRVNPFAAARVFSMTAPLLLSPLSASDAPVSRAPRRRRPPRPPRRRRRRPRRSGADRAAARRPRLPEHRLRPRLLPHRPRLRHLRPRPGRRRCAGARHQPGQRLRRGDLHAPPDRARRLRRAHRRDHRALRRDRHRRRPAPRHRAGDVGEPRRVRGPRWSAGRPDPHRRRSRGRQLGVGRGRARPVEPLGLLAPASAPISTATPTTARAVLRANASASRTTERWKTSLSAYGNTNLDATASPTAPTTARRSARAAAPSSPPTPPDRARPSAPARASPRHPTSTTPTSPGASPSAPRSTASPTPRTPSAP